MYMCVSCIYHGYIIISIIQWYMCGKLVIAQYVNFDMSVEMYFNFVAKVLINK